MEPASVICEAPLRAIPKSATFTFQSGLTITLCGLMSRWTISCRCASPSALRISRANLIAVKGGVGPFRISSSFSVGPSRYSIAM